MSDLIKREDVIRVIRNENSALKDTFISYRAGEELEKLIYEIPSVSDTEGDMLNGE